jgi:LEA14-like dessication related protein
MWIVIIAAVLLVLTSCLVNFDENVVKGSKNKIEEKQNAHQKTKTDVKVKAPTKWPFCE